MNPPLNPFKWFPLLLGIGIFSSQRDFAQNASDVILAWNPSPANGVVGYNLYSGTASQTYTNMVSVGNVTNTILTGLVTGKTYFFSVTAIDTAGLESPFSNEIGYSVPTNIVSGTSNNPPTVANTAPVISSVANQTI